MPFDLSVNSMIASYSSICFWTIFIYRPIKYKKRKLIEGQQDIAGKEKKERKNDGTVEEIDGINTMLFSLLLKYPFAIPLISLIIIGTGDISNKVSYRFSVVLSCSIFKGGI